ncbi:PREDICTED: Cysteine/Histidine-rich C1 domain [Prunus dulcis]|uniref:PREDICTED: Cysteine/Histidine-rich C1 domain n=1 Tax=Prunus dulcis TaxID=3755 RepID=A0A5E4G511_PRUDU|nr:PREDICTED: Cysteine/Histidine-rich C1 domain [Prunus dulcis]
MRRSAIFSNQHSLALISYHHEVHKDNDHHDDVINTRNGCKRPITATNAFHSYAGKEESISSCRFLLHIICAQLPQKRHLLLHWHQLTLIPRASSIDGVFRCYMCNGFSQGFGYHCDNILTDVTSTLSRRKASTLTFTAVFFGNIKQGGTCMGCGTSGHIAWFSCTRFTCNFNLCNPCVKLPPTARYIYDDHRLKLTYGNVKDKLDEHYCEIFQGPRNPKYWFYSCSDCDFDCHPHCVLNWHSQVKLGEAYKHDTHPHPVTLVEKRKSSIPFDKREHILPF